MVLFFNGGSGGVAVVAVASLLLLEGPHSINCETMGPSGPLLPKRVLTAVGASGGRQMRVCIVVALSSKSRPTALCG